MTSRTESFLRGVSNRASLDLDSTHHYAAILGAAPSKGARSPTLWNKAFKALNISAVMHPMDVAPADLAESLRNCADDPRFLGGAVAVPYKQEILRSLDELEDEAQCHWRSKLFISQGRSACWSEHGRRSGPDVHSPSCCLSYPAQSSSFWESAAPVGQWQPISRRPSGHPARLLLANRTPGKEAFARSLRAYCQSEILPTWPVPHEVLAERGLDRQCDIDWLRAHPCQRQRSSSSPRLHTAGTDRCDHAGGTWR